MRYQTEFNWSLKIRDAQGLPKKPKVGKTYKFRKTVERVYPLHIPILLTDDDYKVYGWCEIVEFTVSHGITSGIYKILSLFDNKKSDTYTKDILANMKR